VNPTITTIQENQKNEGDTYAFLIHCCNCYAPVIISTPKDLSSTYGKEKLPGSFKEMERCGVKITSYGTNEER
jgi:hypothetical protein